MMAKVERVFCGVDDLFQSQLVTKAVLRTSASANGRAADRGGSAWALGCSANTLQEGEGFGQEFGNGHSSMSKDINSCML